MTHEYIVKKTFKYEIERLLDKGSEDCIDIGCNDTRIAVAEMRGDASKTKLRLHSV